MKYGINYSEASYLSSENTLEITNALILGKLAWNTA
jgi:hypothetical protein